MKTSTFRLEVLSNSRQLETRPAGILVRQQVLELLTTHDVVALDFCAVAGTPSFIDELVGGLIAELGEQGFRQKINLENISSSLAPLLRHVIATKRIQQRQSAA